MKLKDGECSIDNLPDEIVVEIINRLTLKEAVRTSVLSTRWKYLWTYLNVLHFDPPPMNLLSHYCPNLNPLERWGNYTNWVSKILESHKALKLVGFKIKYEICCVQETVTAWVDTAIAKQVEHLELSFLYREMHSYKFPPIKRFHDLFSSNCFKSLKSLGFTGVYVDTATLEYFTQNCPLLERLFVKNARSSYLQKLKVVGSSIPLKCLELVCCDGIEEVEISAPNLRSFKFRGYHTIKLRFENVAQLVDVCIPDDTFLLPNLAEPISKLLPQIQTLELILRHFEPSGDRKFSMPLLPKLRHLILDVFVDDRKDLNPLTLMIKELPFLHKFTLKMLHRDSRKRIQRFRKWPHHRNLKVVEFNGFKGLPIELELAFYIFENAIALKKMIVDTTTSPSFYPEADNSEYKIDARKRAQLLRKKLPRGVQLVID